MGGEGPEHAENPFHALREFARVLKSGGRLIATIPNYGNIEQRLRVLFFGTAEKAVSKKRFREQFRGDTSMLHIAPMFWAQLRFFLEAAGFEVEAIAKEKTKPKQLFLLPLVLLIQLVTKLQGKRGREYFFADQANSNTILLGGNTLLVMAVKRGPDGP